MLDLFEKELYNVLLFELDLIKYALDGSDLDMFDRFDTELCYLNLFE